MERDDIVYLQFYVIGPGSDPNQPPYKADYYRGCRTFVPIPRNGEYVILQGHEKKRYVVTEVQYMYEDHPHGDEVYVSVYVVERP